MELNYREIFRYLGYRGGEPDPGARERIEALAPRVTEAARPRHVWAEAELSFLSAELMDLGGLEVKSAALARNLRGCGMAVILAATLGVEVDRLIGGASQRGRVSDAYIYQAAAAALIEDYCDRVTAELARKYGERGLFLRPRFSPGYGDFSIEHQRDLLRLTQAEKRVGLTVTDSMLLAPMKSVTAVIGVGKEKLR